MNVCFSFCAVLRANLILFLATKINLKGQFTQKCIFFFHHLLTLMLFQTHTSFLLNTKEDETMLITRQLTALIDFHSILFFFLICK